MYAPQNAPASSAKPIPAALAEPEGRVRSSTPAAAHPTQTRSSGRREPSSPTTSGPTNSKVTAIPSGILSSAS